MSAAGLLAGLGGSQGLLGLSQGLQIGAGFAGSLAEAKAFAVEAEHQDALARMEAERQARIGRRTTGSARAAYGAAGVSGVSAEAVLEGIEADTVRNIEISTLPFRQAAADARFNEKSAIFSGVTNAIGGVIGATVEQRRLFPKKPVTRNQVVARAGRRVSQNAPVVPRTVDTRLRGSFARSATLGSS